jgi:probable DNA metabolism protein
MRQGPVRMTLEEPDDVEGFWRSAALLEAAGAEPEDVVFDMAGKTPDLFDPAPVPLAQRAGELRLAPTELRALLDPALLHSDAERFALAYRLLRRLRCEPHLLAIASDRDISRARDLAKAVRRDKHKMTAFVRFRETRGDDGQPVYVSWFEPDHHIVAATAPFFVRRFANMRWSILTPRRSAHWDGQQLTIGAGAEVAQAANDDPLEEIWRTYYAHIFNPSRLMVGAMRAHMPKKYWHNLPEASLIAPLIATAQQRSHDMIGAAPTAPRRAAVAKTAPVCSPLHFSGAYAGFASLKQLREEGARCQGCPLHANATQAVPGEGPTDARLMLVGEQPGDEEDLAGRPFVGPAGRLLDIALQRAGIDRSACFVTNAVKHFKFEARGKRRLHRNPDRQEIERCRWWLDAERALIKPDLIVALGASAARSLIGRPVKVGEIRGQLIPLSASESLLVTVHPSYLQRLQGEDVKRREWHRFLGDLRLAQQSLAGSGRLSFGAGRESAVAATAQR